ncbi:GNAT family N-acetyltransferase [Amycolatopsis sp. NPDC005232]|uniref:GNAT family N-acetyltransferase n=1 Tax=Amycolatopsis sp. NPDC005232 TaxID=3157027 RepID=UPI0033A15BD7
MTITLAVSQTESAAALCLSPWRLDDLPALVAAHRDPVLRRRLTTSLADEAEARQWLDAQAAGCKSATRFSFAAAAEDDDQTPLGHVGMKVVTAGVAEVGYWTAAQARVRGIATRVLETTSHREEVAELHRALETAQGEPLLLRRRVADGSRSEASHTRQSD